jgi:cellulose synthase operon protein C
MLHVQPQSVRLTEAERLAQEGQYAGAMRIYRDLFDDHPPAGDIARAYYDTEAALQDSRPQAIEGLRRLLKQFPADSQYAITLGRILTYDPKTRAEGVALLERYSSSPEAQKALEQARIWSDDGAKPDATTGAVPVAFERAQSPLEGAAYEALNRGRLDEAERQFKELLARQPANPRALSGLGYVYMKERDFAQAADTLKSARAAGATGLDDAIATAAFWDTMARAGDSLQAGDSQGAVEQYRRALSLKPASTDAEAGLAGALLQMGKPAEAADILKREVSVASGNEPAWRNLFLAQSAMGDPQAALATRGHIPTSVRTTLESDPGYLRALAQDNLALGLTSEANQAIDRALALPFPDHGRGLAVEKQLQFADLLMMAKRPEPAIELYRQALAEDPGNAGAWLSLAGAQHQLGRDDAAFATLSRMPQAVYEQSQTNAGFLQLVASIYQSRGELDRAQRYLERALSAAGSWQPGAELQLAGIYAAEGESQKAYAIYGRELEQNPNSEDAWRGLLEILHASKQDQDALRELASIPEPVRFRLEQDPSYLQTLAAIETAAGQDKDALRTFWQMSQLYLDRQSDEPVEAQLQYGWLLLKTGNDAGLYSVVSHLANSSGMTSAQQAEFNQMWAAWSVRRANSASASGDQRRSLAILEAAARAFPKDASVLDALAGAYLQAGQPKQALLIYSSFDMNQADQGRLQGAIGAALAARDMKEAEAWLVIALVRYKNDPAILRMAAQYEQAQGHQARAAAYYRAALDVMAAEPLQGTPSHSEGSGTEANYQNGASPARDLMQLLATGSALQGGKDVGNFTDRRQGGRAAESSFQGEPGVRTSTQDAFAQSPDEMPSLSRVASASSRIEPRPFGDSIPRASSAESEPDTQNKWQAPVDENRHRAAITSPQRQPAPHASTLSDFAQTENDASSPHLSLASTPETAGAGALPIPQLRRLAVEDETNGAEQLQAAATELKNQSGPTPSRRLPDLDEEFANPSPASPLLPALTGSTSGMTTPKTPRQQVEQQLAIIQGSSSGWIGGTSSLDYRSGQPGFDRLSIYSAQTEGSAMISPEVRTTVIVKPVLLDSGVASGAQTFQQGTLPVTSVPYQQSAAGVGGEFQLQTSSFAARLGYTPYGFLVPNVIGGLYIHPPAGHFEFDFSRDPILDTQLSFAGLRDEGSISATYAGNVWGGVISNAAQLKIDSGDSRAGWYMQGGGQYITGMHVPSNQRIDGDGGAYWAAWKSPYGDLTAGMNFFGMHYQRNLRYFTYGQGGYFSPRAYMLAAVPLTFDGHYGERFHYHATGSLGVQAFQEDSTPYFPLDSAIQAAQGNPYYPEQTTVGGNYDLETEASYAIAEHWYVGGFMAFNNTRDYASDKIGFFLRFVVRPQPESEEGGPNGLFPVQGLRPLHVP